MRLQGIVVSLSLQYTDFVKQMIIVAWYAKANFSESKHNFSSHNKFSLWHYYIIGLK